MKNWKTECKYIAGPITHGNTIENIHRAVMVGEFYYLQGYVSYVPHLFYRWEEMYPKPYEDLIHIGMSILSRFKAGDELVRLPGYSPGADREVEYVLKELDGVDVKIMTSIDCEEVEECLGESFEYISPGPDKLNENNSLTV